MEMRVRPGPVLLLAAGAAVLTASCGTGDDAESATAATEAARSVFTGEAVRWVDLTHPFDERAIYWPTAERFALDTVAEGTTEAGYYYAAYRFSAAEHGGTHMDAPVHFHAGGATAEAVALDRLVGPAAVVDVADSASANPDYRVSVEDLRAWEEAHGRLPEGAVVLLRTGWGERWPDPERYLGTAERGPEAVADLRFPGLHPDAARWLVEEREIAALGLDTPSIDHGQSQEYMAHRVLYAAGIPGFENVANLRELPASGAYVVALPMKIAGGSGAPLRIVAAVPR